MKLLITLLGGLKGKQKELAIGLLIGAGIVNYSFEKFTPDAKEAKSEIKAYIDDRLAAKDEVAQARHEATINAIDHLSQQVRSLTRIIIQGRTISSTFDSPQTKQN